MHGMVAAETRIVAVVPTFNEPAELRRVVESLVTEPVTKTIVINAGDPLPEDLAGMVQEVRVASDCYWTECVNIGFKAALDEGCTHVYLTNADTYALPGTVAALLAESFRNRTVCCSPAYIEGGDGVRLLYSHQDPMGFLLYGKLVRWWNLPSEAPKEPFPIVLTGGQGVLLPRGAVEQFQLDTKRFPQYASDHDLWLTMKNKDWQLLLVPQGGVVNVRTLSANRAQGTFAKLKKLWWRMSSDMSPEGLRTMWRLRRKHLPLIVAVYSTAISFVLRWTIGLPKILKRT